MTAGSIIIFGEASITVGEPSNDGDHLIALQEPTGVDHLRTLENCQGHYACPVGPDGMLLGPVVGYTAPYTASDGSQKKWVGLEYFNFAQADQWPAVIAEFAESLMVQLNSRGIAPDIIVGAPLAGVKLSQEVAHVVGCRHIFAEKKPVGFDSDGKVIEELILGRYEGAIRTGDTVVIGEELVNNASTTKKLIELIESAGGHVMAIICAINRSYPFKQTFWDAPERDPIPIIGVINRSTPQYRQDDPVVAEAIAAGNVVWKPKYEWARLKQAMELARSK